MPLSAIRRHALLTLGFTISLSTGCVSAMPIENGRKIEPPAQTLEAPLRFKRHNFQAFCYNAKGCHILYNDHDFSPPGVENDPDGYVSPPPPGSDYRQAWLGTAYVDIPNFPGPVEVRWKSLDGQPHEASVDLAEIFKDELVWHRVAKEDMAHFFEGPVAGSPDIFLEVNDRTINVYMTMFIPTRKEQVEGNRYSAFRNDIILVWTRTY
jgi:hypothetical protein